MKLQFAAIALSATLVACGGGSGDGDVVGETDIDGIPNIGGGDDVDLGDEFEFVDEDIDLDPNDTFADGCEGGSGTDLDSSTPEWNDNCRIRVGGEHATSSYAQGVQRIVFCRGFNNGLEVAEINSFADGIFGPMTEDQVRNFQEAEGIGQDGIVGPETWETLEAVVELLAANVAGDANVYGVAPGVCANIAQFEQALEDGSWVMTETSGSPNTVPFSVDPPVNVQ